MLISTLLLIACANQSKWDDQTLERMVVEPIFLEETLATHPVDTQDLLLLTLAIRNPSAAGQFCKQVRSDMAKEKCQQVIGRPHLQLSKPQRNDTERSQSPK